MPSKLCPVRRPAALQSEPVKQLAERFVTDNWRELVELGRRQNVAPTRLREFAYDLAQTVARWSIGVKV